MESGIGRRDGKSNFGAEVPRAIETVDVGDACDYTKPNRLPWSVDMLLIGFMWVFIGLAALVLAKPLAPGRWEDTGPAAMMAACCGAFLASSVVVLVMEGPNGYGPPTIAGTSAGIIASLIGGAVGFGGYLADASKRARA
jgi:hypothetical protein